MALINSRICDTTKTLWKHRVFLFIFRTQVTERRCILISEKFPGWIF
nr:MAG TPA: hypothetical protein [Caudoviricetes sp.]